MDSVIPLPLKEEDLQSLVEESKDYAVSHGIVCRTQENPASVELIHYVPFLLLPSPVPRHCYQEAAQVQCHYNLLMHKVAHDYDFLRDCLQHTIKVDDFTRRFWDIYETCRKEGFSQPISLGMNRSDYMLDCGVPSEEVVRLGQKVNIENIQIKQVEFNTIASSFGGLCSRLTELHRYTLETRGFENECKNLPPNNADDGLAEGMVEAWNQYGNKSAVIIFLVEEAERNKYDQRWLEYAVKSRNKNIKILYRSLQQLTAQASLGDNKQLIMEGHEVAIVYFRMCYMPHHFKSEKDWETRLMIERSRAIKCPNVYYHLSGTKKVQQVLARPGMVERFISHPDVVHQIRKTFAGQYSLDWGEEGDKIIAAAEKNPEKYVLKPQREGGGNNFYGEGIPVKLSEIKSTDERSAYILMDRICPAPCKGYMVRQNSKVELADLTSELGIFGVLVGSADKIYLNKHQGHNMRTKTLGTDEGGVATGYAAIDSPYLV